MLLKEGKYIGHPERSLGLRSGEVIEELMGELAQNQNVSQQLRTIYRDLDDDNLESAQAKLAKLREQVGKIPDVLEAQASIDSLRSLEEGGA
ncbi:hypothetical protein SAMN03159318_00215 [Pseudomonas sp. NFACC42-2]|nr:hypothetical protein [Pseudomonas sp. 8 R 14]SFS23985.1 hypothetical protein SAMN03159318_00215 [Pseudomonas sp. NFACC42-2]HAA39733.1 chromosome segregation protein SMC [Pseudomonas sp.]